jgi:glycosyltransferase involved in cell wall biosynthesis
MKVLAWVHLYAPDHCAGAEMMLHEILLGLRKRGHQVAVMCDQSSVDVYEGIPVHSVKQMTAADRHALVDWSDVVITHLDRTKLVIRTVNRTRPIVHLVHNDRQLKFHGVLPRDAQLVVANSQWIKTAIRWRGETLVVHPPVDAARYRTAATAEGITLINLSEQKGAPTFWALAERLPEREFIGVLGGYGPQIVPDVVPPNVTVIDHTPDIKSVYRRTRILLCPSAYESWGRVGVEAMASGIPTIAHPTPGLLESLRGSGTFVDRNDIDGWVAEIQALDDDDIYAARSRQARMRSAELDPTDDIDRLEQALLRLLPKGR